ncbi:MAG TPA: hypothetical protein DEF77_06325, partial [Gammaproteobacteria bacterium]|nr:hypothetical protein [Gammaproteobacteria bacterium]
KRKTNQLLTVILAVARRDFEHLDAALPPFGKKTAIYVPRMHAQRIGQYRHQTPFYRSFCGNFPADLGSY